MGHSSAYPATPTASTTALNPPLPSCQACVSLFTRTARFDIVPNRFGILGQFGPDRKLQLSSTNMSGIVGASGRVGPNAPAGLRSLPAPHGVTTVTTVTCTGATRAPTVAGLSTC